MATYSSLNNAGATGTQAGYLTAPVYNPNAQATSPVSKALSNFSMGTPQTPVKTQSVTHPDGTKVDTTYHAPDVPIKAPATQASDVKQGQTITDTSGNQGVAQFDPMTGKAYGSTAPSTAPTSPTTPTYAGLIGQGATASQNAANTGSQNYNNLTAEATQAYKDAADYSKAVGQKESDVQHDRNYSIDTGVGLAGQIQSNAGLAMQQKNAIAAGLSGQANTAAGLNATGITGLGSNAGLLAPTSNIILRNPTTGAVIGDQNLSDLAKTQGTLSGIQSGAATAAGASGGISADLQTKINAIQSTAPAADAAFSVLNTYAKAVGGGNIPILQGLQQTYGSTAQGSQAVAGFKSQLQAVRSAWTAIEGGDGAIAIPDNVTADQLTQIQQQLKTDAQNKVTGFQNQFANVGGNSTNSSSTSNSGAFSDSSFYGQ